MTDLDEIKEHSIGAGTLVTEIFLHYDDPMGTYLSGSGRCELALTNIDFNSFVKNRAPMDGEIIARGIIPRALIILRAIGSKYTPFHSKSKIEKIYENTEGLTRVIRSCELVPYMEPSIEKNMHALKRKYTFLEYGTYGLGPIGVQKSNHKNGEYDVDRTFFEYEPSANSSRELYFRGESYVSSAPDVVLPPTTNLVSGIIDRLKSNYYYTHFTWWDIFRRLTLLEFNQLQLEITGDVLKKLKNGELTGGVSITHVLSNEPNTGITNPEVEVLDDTIYLIESDRNSRLSETPGIFR